MGAGEPNDTEVAFTRTTWFPCSALAADATAVVRADVAAGFGGAMVSGRIAPALEFGVAG